MSADVDELFGEHGGQPTPRTRLVIGLLVTGILLAVLGLVCTSAPGGLVVLAAWYLVGKDLDRLDNGYLPADARPVVRRLQYAVWASVVFVLVVFAIQGWLLGQGVYDQLWGGALQALGGALGVTRADTPPVP